MTGLLAVALALALTLGWGALGFGVLSALHARRDALQDALLAPTVGLAVTIVPLFLLNLAGLPVSSFAWALVVVLVLVGLGLLVRYRPTLPWRELVPLVAVLLGTLFLVGRPLLEFGFNWVSIENDDMADYALAAQRLEHHGFFDVPPIQNVVNGTDYSLLYWFLQGQHMVRHGTDLVLAWAASLTGLTTVQVYMPLTLALTLVLICAAGGLVCTSRRLIWPALLACLLLGISALQAAEVTYQLAPQVAGLALMAVAGALLFRPFDGLTRRGILRHGLLSGIVVAAFALTYPEIGVFFAPAFVLFAGARFVRRQLTWRPWLGVLLTTATTTLVLLNYYLVGSLSFLSGQVSAGLSTGTASTATAASAATATTTAAGPLFPYFLVPSGLADLWGFQTVYSVSQDPWLSMSIILGGALLILSVIAAGALTWKGEAVGSFVLAMALLAIPIAHDRYDYGLFKLAMYCQPFLLGVLALGCFTLFRYKVRSLTFALAVGLLGILGQEQYISTSSTGAVGQVAQKVSLSSVYQQFQQVISSANIKSGEVAFDTPNVSLAKLQSQYTVGSPTNFLNTYLFGNVTLPDPSSPLYADAMRISDAISQHVPPAFFDMKTDDGAHLVKPSWTVQLGPGDSLRAAVDSGDVLDPFYVDDVGTDGSASCGTLVMSSGQLSILNRRRDPGPAAPLFTVTPCDTASNQLVYVDSLLGLDYDRQASPFIGLQQMEADPLVPGGTMAGLGRYLLFQVINPSQQVRMALDFTTSLDADQGAALPPAAVVGDTRTPFPIEGDGSARVFSPPLSVQQIDGRGYVALDLGQDPWQYTSPRSGLMGLYGQGVALDPRFLTSFARGIAVLSNDSYEQLQPPTRLASFPADLENPDLEYSGMYENGWISDASFFRLAEPAGDADFNLVGQVPEVDDPSFRTDVTILVDGQPVAEQTEGVGNFEIRTPVPPGSGTRRIDIRFSQVQQLPAGDSRLVGARITSLGFVHLDPPTSLASFPTDLQNPNLDYSGMYQDGWISDASFFRLAEPAGDADFDLVGQVPEVDNPSFRTDVTILVDGQPVAEQTEGVGNFEIRTPVPPGSGTRRIDIRFSQVQQLPAGDSRSVGARITSLGFVPAAAPTG